MAAAAGLWAGKPAAMFLLKKRWSLAWLDDKIPSRDSTATADLQVFQVVLNSRVLLSIKMVLASLIHRRLGKAEAILAKMVIWLVTWC
jgi:hypothetical protein